MRHLDGTLCASGAKDGSDICHAHTKLIRTLGQTAFEAWAETFEARPVWNDLPFALQADWENIARAVTDEFIKGMAMDLVDNS